MFQRDLGDWQIRIPYAEKEGLTQLDKKHARSLINHIDSILYEIKETGEKIMRLNIKFDVSGEVDRVNTARVILLRIVKDKLKAQI